jgi:predicted DCC family thiol-disulfide oxidoreductase YuxK
MSNRSIQLGIDPDRPGSFAFLANGHAYVKSEAVLRIARELPRWQSSNSSHG